MSEKTNAEKTNFGGPTPVRVGNTHVLGYKSAKSYMDYAIEGGPKELKYLKEKGIALRSKNKSKSKTNTMAMAMNSPLFTDIDIDYVENDTSKSLLQLFEPDTTIQSLDEYDSQINSDKFKQVYPLIERLPSKEEYASMNKTDPNTLDKRLKHLAYILYMIRKRMNQRIHEKATRIHPEAKVISFQRYVEGYGVISKSTSNNSELIDNFNLILNSKDEKQLEYLDSLLKMLLYYPTNQPKKKTFLKRVNNTLKQFGKR